MVAGKWVPLMMGRESASAPKKLVTVDVNPGGDLAREVWGLFVLAQGMGCTPRTIYINPRGVCFPFFSCAHLLVTPAGLGQLWGRYGGTEQSAQDPVIFFPLCVFFL